MFKSSELTVQAPVEYKSQRYTRGLGPAKLSVPLAEYPSSEERMPFVLYIIHVKYDILLLAYRGCHTMFRNTETINKGYHVWP